MKIGITSWMTRMRARMLSKCETRYGQKEEEGNIVHILGCYPQAASFSAWDNCSPQWLMNAHPFKTGYSRFREIPGT